MSNKKYFIVGRRYWRNDSGDTLKVISERYTRSGYRYLRLRSDLDGSSWEYKVRVKDDEEYIDLCGGAIKNPSLDDNMIIRSSHTTDYIVVSKMEDKFLRGEELEMTIDELRKFFEKDIAVSGSGKIKIKLVF